MDAALWVSKTGLDAQQTRMNVISNNLANVNTTGFKRDRAIFEDLLYQNIRHAGGQTTVNTQAPTGLMLGTGTKIVATEKLHAQGNMINTQNPLDVAIMGDGFFQIAQQDGTIAYTRDGSFKLSATGQLVTSTGFLLQPEIVIPNNAACVSIGRDGAVSVELVGGGGQQVLGQIQISRFVNPSGLKPLGNNLMAASASSGAPQLLQPGVNGAGVLNQGSLESSNVNVVEEMVNMIETQRLRNQLQDDLLGRRYVEVPQHEPVKCRHESLCRGVFGALVAGLRRCQRAHGRARALARVRAGVSALQQRHTSCDGGHLQQPTQRFLVWPRPQLPGGRLDHRAAERIHAGGSLTKF